MRHALTGPEQPQERGSHGFTGTLSYLALGAALMYLADPDRGRRRRARLRDSLTHGTHVLRDAWNATSRDVSNRAHGALAYAKARLTRSPGSDEALELRVRARVGHVVSHPHAVKVDVSKGRVILSGLVLGHELDALLAYCRKVPGVRGVANLLTVYRQPGNVPSLQGGRPRRGRRLPLLDPNWSPTTRLATGLAGAALLLDGLRRSGISGAGRAALGLAMIARGTANLPLGMVLGYGRQRRIVEVHKVVDIHATVEQVFALWTDYEKFPCFLSTVYEVHRLAENRSRWVVAGPAGMRVEWISETTALVPNALIEWHSVDGSRVAHQGSIRFERNGAGGTRLTIRVRYIPPAGALGHAIAKLFRADAKSDLDAGLLRMKTALETGRLPHDAASAQGDNVPPLASAVPATHSGIGM